ncbi:phosphatidate cytidylyltransferase [Cognatishimia sp. WU-CL00825]|uniref:phosphatidate cytidylyltransferase n=1 Tax=Cognatishimia sp. WU-CL00825 TaxID=3127658 RepID=UPI00310A1AEF
MISDGKWGDLGARVLSAIVMLVVGLMALWLGGILFHALVAIVCGGMIWELTRMLAPSKPAAPLQMGLLAGFALFSIAFIPPLFFLPVLLAPAIVGATSLRKDRLIYVAYAAGLLLAAFGLIMLREFRGLEWVVWLVLVVIATDVAGYFAGKAFGGPKFWPKISPKKTWSGTSAGWLAAAVVGFFFAGPGLALVSVAISLASQLGDIAESAIKRRAGVKDSSQLIPGHGGLLDRFDGLMAAALLILVISSLVGLPSHPG